MTTDDRLTEQLGTGLQSQVAGCDSPTDLKPETPEEAAEIWAAEFWDEEGNEFNELMRACGVSGFLAGVRWAEERGRK